MVRVLYVLIPAERENIGFVRINRYRQIWANCLALEWTVNELSKLYFIKFYNHDSRNEQKFEGAKF